MTAIAGKGITTIEGLAQGDTLHAVQRAWMERTSSMRLLPRGADHGGGRSPQAHAEPDAEDIDAVTNICRCGTYPRIRKAIARAATLMKEEARS